MFDSLVGHSVSKMSSRSMICLLTASLSIAASWNTACAQPAAAPKSTKPVELKGPETKKLSTNDRIELFITYYESAAGKESPVVLLLHGDKGRRLDWEKARPNMLAIANQLQAAGNAVITVDLRGHGDTSLTPAGSTKKSDNTNLSKREYSAMVTEDLEAVKNFVFQEHQAGRLNIAKTVLVATEYSAVIAAAYTEFDWAKVPYDDAPTLAAKTPRGQDVRALILLSPKDSVSGIPITKSIARVRDLDLPAAIAVGTTDKLDKGTSKKLVKILDPKHDSKEKSEKPDKEKTDKGDKNEKKEELTFDKIAFWEFDSPLRGSDMLYRQLAVKVGKQNLSLEQANRPVYRKAGQAKRDSLARPPKSSCRLKP